jgi:hypothetical protein
LGVSKVAVYKALNVGRLEFQLIEGRKCIEARNLRARFWGSSQRLADQPAHGWQREPDWEAIGEVLNAYLGDEWPGAAVGWRPSGDCGDVHIAGAGGCR